MHLTKTNKTKQKQTNKIKKKKRERMRKKGRVLGGVGGAHEHLYKRTSPDFSLIHDEFILCSDESIR